VFVQSVGRHPDWLTGLLNTIHANCKGCRRSGKCAAEASCIRKTSRTKELLTELRKRDDWRTRAGWIYGLDLTGGTEFKLFKATEL